MQGHSLDLRGILPRVLSPEGTINAQVHFSTPVSSTRGVLAQLVERNVRNVEVRGSTPLCSTDNGYGLWVTGYG